MPSVFIEINVPDVIRDHFITPDFNPYGPLMLTLKVDSEKIADFTRAIIREIKKQQNSDYATSQNVNELHKSIVANR